MKPVASILISSYNRSGLFKRTLRSIEHRPPSVPFEVIVCDDGSTEDIAGLLERFTFPWKLVPFHREVFEAATGLKKYWNCPAVTNNIAFKHSDGDFIFQMGNEIIAVDKVFDTLMKDAPKTPHWMVMSHTFNIPKLILDKLDELGTNLTGEMVEICKQWPLQSHGYRSDVTNYISLAPRKVWEELDGYNEQYYGGISKEDSDFVRRARKLPGFSQVISGGISLHQYHEGKTCYYDPPPSLITREQWDIGVEINKKIYDDYDQTHKNPQTWPIGAYGAGEVVKCRYY